MDYIGQGLLQALNLLIQGDPETYSAIWVSPRVSSASIPASVVLGIPLGFLLGHYAFAGKMAVAVIIDNLLSMPTMVIGLLETPAGG
ncbi:MAG: hypothetical protein K9K82_11065 [Desulfobacteraceae bacterium]|nr:hypothetical protein [Desulfobacteraceae bacterium]